MGWIIFFGIDLLVASILFIPALFTLKDTKGQPLRKNIYFALIKEPTPRWLILIVAITGFSNIVAMVITYILAWLSL